MGNRPIKKIAGLCFYRFPARVVGRQPQVDRQCPVGSSLAARYGPRGVLDCTATATETPGEDPRFGPWGLQSCKDTGPLTIKRMETIDDEFTDHALAFIDDAVKAGDPFFVWHNPSRMHIYTHLRPEHRLLAAPYSSAEDVYGSGMMELDMMVGRMVDHLETLGVADDTIILFTSDNGAMSAWWPDGGTTPFRGEKATTWEGGVRVPMLVRWPARIPEGSVSNGIQSHLDLFTTLAAAAGVPDVAERLEAQDGVKIDGLNNLATWTEGKPSAREVQLMYNEDQLTALRIGPWKIHRQTRDGFFGPMEQSALIFNLRMDPYEQRDGHRSNALAMKKAFLGGRITDVLSDHYRSLEEFPPRQAGGSLRPR